jgi:hypothetical protein
LMDAGANYDTDSDANYMGVQVFITWDYCFDYKRLCVFGDESFIIKPALKTVKTMSFIAVLRIFSIRGVPSNHWCDLITMDYTLFFKFCRTCLGTWTGAKTTGPIVKKFVFS